jgi:formylglycine-generating enzyme
MGWMETVMTLRSTARRGARSERNPLPPRGGGLGWGGRTWRSATVAPLLLFLLAACYEPLEENSLCHFADPVCAEEDWDGDGVPNGEDEYPWDGACAAHSNTDCGGGGVACESVGFIPVPSGQFEMGSTEYSDEQLVHPVTIAEFEMVKTEVTVQQYRVCVDAGHCSEPDIDTYCNWGQCDRDDHPINCVDWDQARDFCTFVGGRLPTEAEWEYAARSGGKDITYPWGDEEATCERAIMDDGAVGCGQGRTWSVCSKPAGNSDQGLCDLVGNVWEWTEDCWHDSYNGAPSDGSAWVDNCEKPARVVRGGSWYVDSPYFLRAAHRGWVVSTLRRFYLGFRCVVAPRS